MQRIDNKIKKISAYAKGRFIELNLLDDAIKNRSIHSSIFNLKGDMDLFKKLASQSIVCSPRRGGIRVSFHYYNELADLDKLVSHLRKSIQ